MPFDAGYILMGWPVLAAPTDPNAPASKTDTNAAEKSSVLGTLASFGAGGSLPAVVRIHSWLC